ncbi:hypothetical protein D9M72_636630 [compost metagenome]
MTLAAENDVRIDERVAGIFTKARQSIFTNTDNCQPAAHKRCSFFPFVWRHSSKCKHEGV